ncbi:MAG: GtrA family protein [Oscillospiraceae bacterium]
MKKFISLFPQCIQKLYCKYESGLLYIFFGGLTTLVSIGTQYLAAWLGAPTALSTTISWICAVTFAFFTNRTCVFKSTVSDKRGIFREGLQFFGARLFSYFLELGFMIVTVDVLGLNQYIMKLIAQIFVLVLNYLFSKFIIFAKKTKKSNGDDKDC